MNNDVYQDVATKVGCPWRLLKAIHINNPTIGLTPREWKNLDDKYSFGSFDIELAKVHAIAERLKLVGNISPFEDASYIRNVIWNIPHENFTLRMDDDVWVARVWYDYFNIYTSERDILRVFVNNFRLPCFKVTVRRGKIWIHEADVDEPRHRLGAATSNYVPFKVKIDGNEYNFTRIKITEEGDLLLWTTPQ